ncbi:hypothetical protein - conserved [Leishmania donovani]|uniref:Uncharacterized protein n=3 Tax=Leishmania donovani species complex TaxID=38574 RepID=A4HY86_LEIIN|nr:conserved hypothetical protein [Leishmania infantum JPCM5]CAC9482804.1 hypothetical_protein_-_conserved [Leishmania infantum]CAJ1988180.1 hypothetical protein - conserved [Leishmania donovani]CAM67270.2 conserved hypothetical protein [Leishmania infantum JPCM5]SUZ41162.1 hypothetical_protein_-_conserved [Leishmania infantum]VDZ44067.1 hypothetical_protein_conserved [Leishmania donovani]|eukprot:XP_001465027.2 conserved hypothetical protein [Leishmania infantum JPCM5]
MSCSLSTFPTTRQACPIAPVSALRAAVERLQQPDATAAGAVDTRRPNYLLDVPVSAIDVDRWEKRWQEAMSAVSSSLPSLGVGTKGQLHFQHASMAYAALMTADEASAPTNAPSSRHLAPLPPFVFATVKTLPMTQLLKMRRQWLPHRQRFAVHQQRMGFLDAVLSHAVVALVGPAGSGRTLQVPIVLSETEVLKRRRLIVVSANAAAARLTTLRLREERGEDVQHSRTVAAAVPNHNETTESTSVVVTTAEVMLRQLLCDPCLEDVGCVVFDDAHLRNESTELCLSLLRDLLAVHQQWEHQRGAPARSAVASSSNGSAAGPDADTAQGPDAARRRRLHIVLNCPDEACATTLLSFLAPSRCTATTFVLQTAPTLVTANTTLYLEEAVQWLLKTEKEGSCLISDSAAMEATLVSYAENVDAVARIMAAGDADFAHPAAFRRYWLPLIQQCVDEFDKADRGVAGATAAQGRSPLSAIVLVAPNNHYVHVIANAVREAQRTSAERDAAASRVCTALAEDSPFSSFLTVAQRTAVRDACQRWIIVATSELSQSVLPSGLDVGLVVDCARNGYTTVDTTTMADTVVIEYSTIAQLRHRRKLAKMTATASPAAGGDGSTPASPVVIQLIPKSILHGAHHRRLSADPAQHIIFRLPFSRYVQVYQVLQAREEAALSQRAAFSLSAAGGANLSSAVGGGPSIASKVSTVLASQLIGVPAATATRYEAVRRIMASVESYLRAAGHLAVDHTAGSPAMGQLVLQPMAVLSLCLPVPLQVGRLLIVGSLLRSSLAAVTAVGALWCCSDLLSLQGAGAVRVADASDAAREAAEEQAALLTEARLFFSRDSLSDVVSAFHVYQMWCSTKANPEAERDFLAECGVAGEVLQAVFDTQVQLCMLMRTYGLLLQPGEGGERGRAGAGESEAERTLRVCVESVQQSTSESVAQVSSALGGAMAALPPEVATSRALHACVTAALYPSCVVPTGEEGIGLVYDGVSTSSIGGAGGGGESSGSGSPAAGTGRRVASFSSDCVLADAVQCAKAAGRPFLFLAKSIADVAAREAAVMGASSTVAATVVEQVDPLHEAAAVVFCGHFHERPRKAPTRCRGWSSVLTSRWRETRRARALPPVSQLPPTCISVQSYDTVHCNHVICTMDQNLSLTMRSTSAKWLQQLRTHVGAYLAALACGVATSNSNGSLKEASSAVAAELAEAWEWWERRHEQGRDWLREERLVVAHQQQQTEAAAAGYDKQEQAASAAKVAALRQRLFGYYEWQIRPGTPAAVVVPSNAERQAFAKSAAAAAAKGSGEVDNGDAGAAAEDDDPIAEGAGGVQATYSGKVPPADIDHIFRLCVKSVAAKGTREAEAQLLRDNPDMFGFLNPEDEFHEYYLYLLRQAAPDMEVLGDNLEELIAFLEDLEAELRGELGLPHPNAAAQEDAGGVLGRHGNGEDGAYGASAAGIWGGDMSADANGQWNSGPFGGGYAVHDVPVGEGDVDGYGDGDSGGLQLESAAINLKKSAGPTLAEKIEEAKRAQANAASTTGKSADVAPPMMIGTPAAPVQMSVPAAPSPASVNTPFVSTNAGETLADKLRAMQMAAMGGSAGNTSDLAPLQFSAQPNADPTSVQPESAAPCGVLPPPPTAADLLAVINGGDSADVAPPQASLDLDFQQAPPTAEELLDLLGPALPTAAPDDPFAAGSSLGSSRASATLPSAAMAAMMMGMPTTPLHRPPPAIPAKAVEERPPSVLVYPVPDIRKYGNVRLLLAKSLSESLNMRVGPTTIVGHVARIDVPNRNVEARALALKKFTCGDTKITVHLFKNDRIIDDPEREERERRKRREELRQQEAELHLERRRRTGAAAGGDTQARAKASRRAGNVGAALTGSAGIDPTSPDAFNDPSAYSADAPVLSAKVDVAKAAPMRIGVLSSSEDDDDASSSADSSSSSSSE